MLDALGKIGSPVSVVRALPVLLEGTEGQRAAAARALARIADETEGDFGDKALTRTVREALEKVVDKDPSKKVRFYSLVAYAKLDGHLDPARILAVLGGGLEARDLDGVSKLLDRKRTRPKGRGGRTLI